MIFLFKKKKVVLDCFTYRPDVFAYYPIEKASKYIPDWWKKLPNTFQVDNEGVADFSTMKSCAGFMHYYSNAITIPMWTDINLKSSDKDGNINWFFRDTLANVATHDPRQKGEYLTDPMANYRHLKFITPWIFRCKEEIQFLFSGNTWGLNNPEHIIIPPGVINYKYQHTTNINMFVRINGTQISNIQAGDSIVHIFPLTEREIQIKNHFIDEKDYRNIENLGASNTLKSYFKHRHILKENEKTGKCPMSSIFKG